MAKLSRARVGSVIRASGFCLAALPLLLAGCSSSKSGDGSNSSPTAASPEEAVSRLSAQDRQSLDAWKKRLTKSCEVLDVFPSQGSTDGAPLVDVAALASATGGASVIRGGAGEFVILGRPNPALGTEESTVSSSSSGTDGQTRYGMNAQASRSGAHCKVQLFGQVVAEADLATSVPVLAQYDASHLQAAAHVSVPPQEAAATRNGLTQISPTPFLAPLTPGLAVGDRAFPLLASALGISETVSRSIFVAQSGSLFLSVSAPGLAGSVPFAAGADSLIGTSEAMAALISARSRPLALKLTIPQNLSASPSENLIISAVTRFDGTLSQGGEASLVSLELSSTAPLSDAAAANCFADRLEALRMLEGTSPRGVLTATFEKALAPCQLLAVDGRAAIFSASRSRNDFASVFSVDASWADYGDWAAALLDFAVGLGPSATLAGQLDPERQYPPLQRASSRLGELAQKLSRFPTLQSLARSVLELGVSSGLAGTAVDPALEDALLGAAAKTAPELMASTRALLESAATSGEATVRGIVDYAQSLSAENIALAGTVQGKATALHLDDWRGTAFDSFLQDQVPVSRLQAWNATLDAAAEYAQRESQRISPETASSPGALTGVLKHALDESWTRQSFELAEKIASFGALKLGCDIWHDDSSILGCVGLDKVSVASGKLMDPAFQGRYGDLAAHFLGYSGQLASDEELVRIQLSTGFWDPIWASCSAQDFGAKDRQLGDLVTRLVSESDSLVRFQLENQIRDTLRDCQAR